MVLTFLNYKQMYCMKTSVTEITRGQIIIQASIELTSRNGFNPKIVQFMFASTCMLALFRHVCVRARTLTCGCGCVFMHLCLSLCVCIYAFVFKCVCMCVRARACVCVQGRRLKERQSPMLI